MLYNTSAICIAIWNFFLQINNALALMEQIFNPQWKNAISILKMSFKKLIKINVIGININENSRRFII